MILEALYLFIAMALLTALSTWLNLKAGTSILKFATLTLVLMGLAGMLLVIGSALFGWDLTGGIL